MTELELTRWPRPGLAGPVVSYFGEALQAFAVGADRLVEHMCYDDGGGWYAHRDWGRAPMPALTPPVAVPWIGTRGAMYVTHVEVFYVGVDLEVYQRSLHDREDWSEWQPLGSPPGMLAMAPLAMSLGPDHVQVLVTDRYGTLHGREWDGEKWAAWRPVVAAPPVGTREALDVVPHWAMKPAERVAEFFATGLDGEVYTCTLDDNDWLPVGAVHLGRAVGSPEAIAVGTDRMLVFIRTGVPQVFGKRREDGVWQPAGNWQHLYGDVTHTPVAALYGPPGDEEVHLFGLATAGPYINEGVWDMAPDRHPQWRNIGAHPSGHHGDGAVGRPFVVRRDDDRLDLFAVHMDSKLYHAVYDGQWTPGGGAQFEEVGISGVTAFNPPL